jgi:hypothetical protein
MVCVPTCTQHAPDGLTFLSRSEQASRDCRPGGRQLQSSTSGCMAQGKASGVWGEGGGEKEEKGQKGGCCQVVATDCQDKGAREGSKGVGAGLRRAFTLNWRIPCPLHQHIPKHIQLPNCCRALVRSPLSAPPHYTLPTNPKDPPNTPDRPAAVPMRPETRTPA